MCERAHLKGIKSLCGEGSAPELKDWVFVTTMDDIVFPLPNFDSNTTRIGGNITMRPAVAATGTTAAIAAGKWERWDVAKTDNGYSANRKDDHYEPKFEYFIPRLDEVKGFVLAKARGEKLVIVGTDNNGKMRLMVNAELMYDEQSKGKNGYKIEFVCGPVPDTLPFYAGEIKQ
jgi:hypothetical protein